MISGLTNSFHDYYSMHLIVFQDFVLVSPKYCYSQFNRIEYMNYAKTFSIFAAIDR